MARVMIVAGGAWQCPIAKLVKSKGHFVICSNLYKDSPAFRYADVCIVADVLDKEGNLEAARKYRPDAVLTDQSDIAVPTVAYIAEELGLKGIGTKLAAQFTNKYLMRQAAEKAGVASPKFQKCSSIDEAKEFLRQNGKCIIKPLDSQSSRGVHIIERPQDLEDWFDDSIRYSNTEKAALIEEYIGGTEFTVDGLATEDGYIVTAISQKEHFPFNPNVASRLVFSHDNDHFDYEELRRVNCTLVKNMGLPFGQTHAEYKFDKNRFYLIEIAARGGGTKISSDIVPLISGINNNEVFIDSLLGVRTQTPSAPAHAFAVLGFFDYPAGKVMILEGIEEAWKLPGVHDFHLNFQAGDMIRKAADDSTRNGYYIVYAESLQELNQREAALKRTIRVTIDPTEDGQ